MYKCSCCGQFLDKNLYCSLCNHWDIKAREQKALDDKKKALTLKIIENTKNFGDIPNEEKPLAKVISLSSHRSNKQIDSFYKETEKLTEHLKDDQ